MHPNLSLVNKNAISGEIVLAATSPLWGYVFMPSFTKQKSTLHLLLTNSNQATAHGGQLLIDALCRRFGLWKRIHKQPALDPRKRTSTGFAPAANIAQLVFTLTSGGGSLADAER